VHDKRRAAHRDQAGNTVHLLTLNPLLQTAVRVRHAAETELTVQSLPLAANINVYARAILAFLRDNSRHWRNPYILLFLYVLLVFDILTPASTFVKGLSGHLS
jgi:hypothetical protein